MCVLKDVQRDTSDHSTLSNETGKVEMLMKLINRLDGGGIQLLKEPNDLKTTLSRRPDLFYHICESYILGMVCYGSYFPLEPILHDHQKIKENTLVINVLLSLNFRKKWLT